MDQYEHMDTLVTRARMLIMYMSDVEATEIMVKKGANKGDVFLAIKAAQILNKEITGIV
jgi:hypothetical protein